MPRLQHQIHLQAGLAGGAVWGLGASELGGRVGGREAVRRPGAWSAAGIGQEHPNRAKRERGR